MNQRLRGVLALVALVVVVVVLLWSRGGGPDLGSGNDVGRPPTHSTGAADAVAAADLPPEARRTLVLIDRGGPFPYPRDGVTFRNAERLLPARAAGFYREYTVPTPGSSDRGARRIVRGQDGALYYSQDHYQSFDQIIGAKIVGAQ
jgi:ribonuclease T1